MLLCRSRQEARHILKCYERNVERIAEADEARGLVGSVYVEHSGEERRLVGYYTDCLSAESCEADDHVLGELRHHLEEVLVVNHRCYDILNVVWLVRVLGYNRLQAFDVAVDVVVAGDDGRVLHVV